MLKQTSGNSLVADVENKPKLHFKLGTLSLQHFVPSPQPAVIIASLLSITDFLFIK